MSRLRQSIAAQVVDDFQRKRKQMIWLLIILGVVGLGMSVLNFFTGKHQLMIATFVFGVFSLVSGFIGSLDKKNYKIASVLFAIEVFLLFSYFIINGGTEGFSTIWLLLLPACGAFALGIRVGGTLSLIVYFELVFYFYTPIGRSLLQCNSYTESFLQRFPILYFVFLLIGMLLELVREETYIQLEDSRRKYEFISKHDILTKIYNRVGFNEEIDKCFLSLENGKSFALLILDIDYFKKVNDTYGHSTGDKVLCQVADRIKSTINEYDAIVCRWGGEEFAILINGEDTEAYVQIAESVRTAVSVPMHVGKNNISVTISVGAVCSDRVDDVNASRIVTRADAELYKAKSEGRNRVSVYEKK